MRKILVGTLLVLLIQTNISNAQTITTDKIQTKSDTMTYEIISLGEINIIGISVRTTNHNGQSQKDIGELWGKFMSQNLIVKIPNKENDEILCIYTDYESDVNGAYTTILGCKVSSLKDIPPGFTSKTIPATKYQLYKAHGKLPDCVLNTWKYIWQSDINRKYVADFDWYKHKKGNSDESEVDTYLSVQ